MLHLKSEPEQVDLLFGISSPRENNFLIITNFKVISSEAES